MKFNKPIQFCIWFGLSLLSLECFCQTNEGIGPDHKVTLKEAHLGNEEIDTRLLDSYGTMPQNIRQFYLEARELFSTGNYDFTSSEILKVASGNQVSVMGGPMLGDLKQDGVSIWLRPVNDSPLLVKVTEVQTNKHKMFPLKPKTPGQEERIVLKGLAPDTEYNYLVLTQYKEIAGGSFRTAPLPGEQKQLRLAFGSCFHKIGLHNPNLIQSIVNRKPHAMLLLGDIAVDDRENNINMHRSDYLLRDVSQAWKNLAAHIPLYACWDDHDYLNNDLSGVPGRFSEDDREALRTIWDKNWNNPKNDLEGIYFNTRIGPVEIIMLDTRSCRTIEKRRQHGSYLGTEQHEWLKNTLRESTAPFKIVSSGTMWSDDVSNGKDSWGTWDTLAREEIFNLIETDSIPGVLFISGDRHGARGFKIPRSSGSMLYEFEAASLGGVPGPPAMAKDPSNQIFGYHGEGLKAFGEFTFETKGSEPRVVFRLIDEWGKILEEHVLSYKQLTPR